MLGSCIVPLKIESITLEAHAKVGNLIILLQFTPILPIFFLIEHILIASKSIIEDFNHRFLDFFTNT